jgi:hypothetical protein
MEGDKMKKTITQREICLGCYIATEEYQMPLPNPKYKLNNCLYS